MKAPQSTISRRGVLLAAPSFGLVACLPGLAHAQLVQSGTVEIEQVQVAFIGSGNLGGGRLNYGGRTYPFSVGGLGVGGFGVSKMQAAGEVYNLRDASDFPGGYGQARTGIAIGDQGRGNLWLQNDRGVVMKLRARREGLALSMGADAVFINFK